MIKYIIISSIIFFTQASFGQNFGFEFRYGGGISYLTAQSQKDYPEYLLRGNPDRFQPTYNEQLDLSIRIKSIAPLSIWLNFAFGKQSYMNSRLVIRPNSLGFVEKEIENHTIFNFSGLHGIIRSDLYEWKKYKLEASVFIGSLVVSTTESNIDESRKLALTNEVIERSYSINTEEDYRHNLSSFFSAGIELSLKRYWGNFYGLVGLRYGSLWSQGGYDEGLEQTNFDIQSWQIFVGLGISKFESRKNSEVD